MGDYHPPRSSSPKGMTHPEGIAKAPSSPIKNPTNPLAVASLTSASLLDTATKMPSTSKQIIPTSRSQPFSCPSLDETLLVHGASAPTHPPKFRLQMRQEPKHGLAVGNDESAFKNARVTPLDPPPICELVPERSSDVRFISVPELSVQACLVYSESPFAAVANSSKDKDPMMSGLQECGFIAPISGRHEECLFVFSELGIRTAGEYRIRFDLIDRLGSQFRRLTSIYTQPFTVVADKKNFPGLSASTELIHSLVRRGLKLRVIKSQSGKARKRKKTGSNSMDVTSASGQSITPSPSSYHPLQQQQQHQQQPPFSPTDWKTQPYRQHSQPYLNPPQSQHSSRPHSPTYQGSRPVPYFDKDRVQSPSIHSGFPQQHRHAPSLSADLKQRTADVTPSLSPSTGSKTSTDSSVSSVGSTPAEEHHFRRLPGPPLAYLTPRSQPHPSYSNESREEDLNRPFQPRPPSSHNESSQQRSSASYSRMDLPRPPPLETLTRSRPTLPPLRSFDNSPPSQQSSSNR